MLFDRLRYAVAGLALVLVGGVLGYRLIEGWSWLDAIWMVVITLSTVGYAEPLPLSPYGRIHTILLLLVGLGLVTYSLSEFARFIVDGGLVRALLERRRTKIMKNMSDHFIVVGYGRLGREACAEIAARGHRVVVIEREDIEEPDAVVVQGDGTSDDVLRTAGIARAKGLTACAGDTATNLFVTLSARQLSPELRIICRVADESSAQKALRIGADAVINPYGISGQRMAQGLLQPVSATMVDRTVGRRDTEFDLADVPIRSEACVGPLRELEIANRHSVLVVAVRKSDGSFHRGFERDVQLAQGDVAVVAGRPEDIEAFAQIA